MTRLGCALALVVALGGTARAANAGFGELTPQQVAEKIKQKNVYVFDCNPREEWLEGHVPTAKWVDFSQLTAKSLPADKTATLIFYCQNEH
jgi:rhodanese-related sulfurtransferase